MEKQILTFSIQGQLFGLDILHVKEINEYTSLTKVPLVPEFILGVLNLRGNVVPVIDLAKRFSWPSSPISRFTCIIITEVFYEEQALEIAVLVDAVKEVLTLSEEELSPPPNFGAKIRTDFIEAVFKTKSNKTTKESSKDSNTGNIKEETKNSKNKESFILLLNINKVLSIEELSELHTLSQSEPNHDLSPTNETT